MFAKITISLFMLAGLNATAQAESTSIGKSNVEKSVNVYGTSSLNETQVQFSGDKMLSLSQPSQVIIYDSKGYVIYKNDNLERLNCSSWNKGRYIVVINSNKTFNFSI